MALIVEDGSGIVPTANSYVTRAEIITYAGLRGVLLGDTNDVDVLAIKAMDYLATLNWKGQRTSETQPLDWPRECVTAGFAIVGSDVIPVNIKNAQCQLAMDAKSLGDLLPTQSGGSQKFVLSQKLGPIERAYSEAVAVATAGNSIALPLANAMLAAYLRTSNVTRSYRV